MITKTKPPVDYAGREFLITREFAASRELVFRTWTDPKHLAQWWGPRGFTNPVCEWDVRSGGKIYDVMRAPNGERYPMGGEFREVVAPEKLVFSCGALDEKGDLMFEFLHTITFVEQNGKTKLTIQSRVLRTTAEANKYIGGYEMGMTSSLEKLAEVLTDTANREIISTRIFAAPRELVFKAFSDPNHLVHWWGPKGFTNTFHEFDLKPGGIWRFVMHAPNGTDYPNEKQFTEIVKPERIGFQHLELTHRFHMTMTFTDQSGKTKLTWHMLFESAAECAKLKPFILEANEQNFDRLGEHLAKMS